MIYLQCKFCDYRLSEAEYYGALADFGCPRCGTSLINYRRLESTDRHPDESEAEDDYLWEQMHGADLDNAP